MSKATRPIGPIGTFARVLTGLALLFIAGDGSVAPPWGIEADDAVVGLIVLPAIMVSLALAIRRHVREPIRFTGPLGIALNLAVIIALLGNDFTGEGGAAIFYGATLLLAAWRGQAGCEITVVPNLVLGRDDQIGCPTFHPIDAVEAHVRRRQAAATG
jgi:hypothetical protein